MDKERLKPIRDELFTIQMKLNAENLSKEEKESLTERYAEVKKMYARTLVEIKKGENDEKYQGR